MPHPIKSPAEKFYNLSISKQTLTLGRIISLDITKEIHIFLTKRWGSVAAFASFSWKDLMVQTFHRLRMEYKFLEQTSDIVL